MVESLFGGLAFVVYRQYGLNQCLFSEAVDLFLLAVRLLLNEYKYDMTKHQAEERSSV